jgi:flavin reductase (DIM6/NTAB) family NADH-FMN oxidoreductase RutF
MEKIQINNNAFLYPMPVVLIGTVVDGTPNFMTVAWVSRVNSRPPLVAVAIGKSHHSHKGMQENRQFSVNIPDQKHLEVTDYCGLVSGKQADKSPLFDVIYGHLEFAPMIQQCPVVMECSIVETVNLPVNTLFIGEIVGAYADNGCLRDGVPDIRKIQPITLTMPDNTYWSVGDPIAKAWSAGKGYAR